MYWVYVLVNRQAGKRYIGQTEDLQRRLSEHNHQVSLGNHHRFTSKFPGKWELIYSEAHSSRSEVMQREKWLKSGVGRAWLDRSIGRARSSGPD